jgi:hypothetical protein
MSYLRISIYSQDILGSFPPHFQCTFGLNHIRWVTAQNRTLLHCFDMNVMIYCVKSILSAFGLLARC